MAKKAAKAVDPNRVPVKRERSEMYRLVGALEATKTRRAVLVRKLAGMKDVEERIKLADEDIIAIGKRLTELTNTESIRADCSLPIGGA